MSNFLSRILNRWRPTLRLKFAVVVAVERDEDRFHAFCPSLKGLHADGATIEEAVHSAAQLAFLYIQSLIKHNDPIPLGLYISKEDRSVDNYPLPDNYQTKTLQIPVTA